MVTFTLVTIITKGFKSIDLLTDNYCNNYFILQEVTVFMYKHNNDYLHLYSLFCNVFAFIIICTNYFIL